MKKTILSIFALFVFSSEEANAQVVVIDAGHGVQSSCVNCDRPDEEVLTVMAVANLLKDTLLQNCSWTVQMTRVSNACGQCPSLNQRENMANSWGADRFISIHGNAGGGTGTETFWCSQGSSSNAAASAFCQEVQDRMVQFGNWTDRRSVEDNSYLSFHLGVLNNQNAPACLSEIAFYDNPSDWAIMSQTSNQADYAHAYRVALETDMNSFCNGGTPPTPPGNDACSGAITLQTNTSCVNTSGTVSNATASGVSQPSCDGAGSPAMLDVWFKFVATETNHTITQAANSSFDGVIALYSSCGGSPLFCSDNGGTGANETINATGLSVGNTYYIRVYDYGTVAPTDPVFNICVTGQPNTNLPDLEITSGSTNPSSVDAGLTTELTYTIINSGAGTVNTLSQTGYYLVPTSQGCPTSIPGGSPFFQGQLSVAEMATNTETEVHVVTIPAGTTPDDYYVVIVTDWENVVAEEDETNNIFCATLTVTDPGGSGPANDNCAGATTITSNTTCINTAGALADATASGVAQPSCDGFGSPTLLDVWFKFVATATTHAIIQTANASFDGIIALYSSCGGSELYCADNGGTGTSETINATGLSIGSTYYIRVYDYGSVAPTDPIFNICVTGQPAADVELQADVLSAPEGGQVAVPIRVVSGFADIGSMQFTIEFDDSKLSYVQSQSYNLNDLNASDFANPVAGAVTLSWFDSQGDGETRANGTVLFELLFDVTGSNGQFSPITFTGSQTSIEIADATPTVLNETLNSGQVNIISSNSDAVISGKIQTETGQNVNTVDVVASCGTNAATNSSGNYALTVPDGVSCTVAPEKTNDMDLVNGITTLDILFIQRHILQQTLLSSAYNVIAADVNASSSVTTLDILNIQSLILGNSATLPNGAIWSFVPDYFNFDDPMNPWPHDTQRSYGSTSNASGEDFVAMKLGDVNGSWNPAVLKTEEFEDQVILQFPELKSKIGEYIDVPLTALKFDEMSGIQFTISWDSNIFEFDNLSNGNITPLLGTSKLNEGKLGILWNAENGGKLSLNAADELFNIRFKVKANGHSDLKVNSLLTMMEAVNTDLELVEIIANNGSVVAGIENNNSASNNLRIMPNPFTETTTIEFDVMRDGNVTLSIFDIAGKRLLDKKFEAKTGKQKYILNRRLENGNVLVPGSYLIEISDGDRVRTARLIYN